MAQQPSTLQQEQLSVTLPSSSKSSTSDPNLLPNFACSHLISFVFGFLAEADLCRLTAVNRAWSKLSNNPALWKLLYQRRFHSLDQPNDSSDAADNTIITFNNDTESDEQKNSGVDWKKLYKERHSDVLYRLFWTQIDPDIRCQQNHPLQWTEQWQQILQHCSRNLHRSQDRSALSGSDSLALDSNRVIEKVLCLTTKDQPLPAVEKLSTSSNEGNKTDSAAQSSYAAHSQFLKRQHSCAVFHLKDGRFVTIDCVHSPIEPETSTTTAHNNSPSTSTTTTTTTTEKLVSPMPFTIYSSRGLVCPTLREAMEHAFSVVPRFDLVRTPDEVFAQLIESRLHNAEATEQIKREFLEMREAAKLGRAPYSLEAIGTGISHDILREIKIRAAEMTESRSQEDVRYISRCVNDARLSATNMLRNSVRRVEQRFNDAGLWLTTDQTIHLKNHLIELIVQEEGRRFFREPTLSVTEDSVCLKFMHNQFVHFPLFNPGDSQLREKVDNLFLSIPKFTSALSKSTRRDWEMELNRLVSIIVQELVRTPEEQIAEARKAEAERLLKQREYEKSLKLQNSTEIDLSSPKTEIISEILGNSQSSDSLGMFESAKQSLKEELEQEGALDDLSSDDGSSLLSAAPSPASTPSTQPRSTSFHGLLRPKSGSSSVNKATLSAASTSSASLSSVSSSSSSSSSSRGLKAAEKQNQEQQLKEHEAARKKEMSKHSAELLLLIQQVIQYTENSGGALQLYRTIRSTPNMHDLPPTYLRLIGFMRVVICHVLEDELKNPDSKRKLKQLCYLTPVTPLKIILKITNPIKLLDGLVTLFLAKPFGAKNLIQQIVEVVTEVRKTKSELKEAKKLVDSNVCKKIHAYVYEQPSETGWSVDDINFALTADKNYKRRMVLRVLRSENTKPHLAFSESDLSPTMIENIYSVLMFELRHRDKSELSDMCGNAELIKLIKDVIPIVLAPMIDLYTNVDITKLITHIFDMLYALIKVADLRDGARKHEAYNAVMGKFFDDVYRFMNVLTQSDMGAVENIIIWLTKLLDISRTGSVDVSKLVKGLEIEERNQLIDEVDALIAHHQEVEQQRVEDRKFRMHSLREKQHLELLAQQLAQQNRNVHHLKKGSSAATAATAMIAAAEQEYKAHLAQYQQRLHDHQSRTAPVRPRTPTLARLVDRFKVDVRARLEDIPTVSPGSTTSIPIAPSSEFATNERTSNSTPTEEQITALLVSHSAQMENHVSSVDDLSSAASSSSPTPIPIYPLSNTKLSPSSSASSSSSSPPFPTRPPA